MLATGSTYSELSFTFRTGISTVSSIVIECMKVIWSKLQPLHMPVPTEQDFVRIAKRFYDKWDMPNCLGAIDGRHVRIKRPAHSGLLYYNYKKIFSIVLQAVFDADYKYLFIDVGNYGHQSDGGTFRSSNFYKALTSNILKIPRSSKLPGSNMSVPYFFVRDGAYPLLEYVMKPYPDKNVSSEKTNFNARLSRARVVAENGFARTSQLWRIYYTKIEKTPTVVDWIVKSTCVLHNMIIDVEKVNQNSRINNSEDSEGLVSMNNDESNVESVPGKIRVKWFRTHAHVN
ncbi:protein ALP1-like [Copidosoma floridanum]|uniref:protein ALP1-like n=1 Tax=Copidosoma floridanum TaxID=29053 RepID=UPI000C6F62EC|nr:protein ALP1-like [Copidosoma floridanum]